MPLIQCHSQPPIIMSLQPETTILNGKYHILAWFKSAHCTLTIEETGTPMTGKQDEPVPNGPDIE